ncbi:MAG TPA: hypothetical protein ENF21_03965 [Bacteroidetes bacterium]|nr:hypothetical protein [Bacteroidota bacterium]
MKKLTYIISIALILGIMGCERGYEIETVSETKPELHVFVQDDLSVAVAGATVIIYKNEDDYNNQANALASKSTDAEGKAVFTKSELKEPGIFYVYASEGSRTNAASTIATPYMLLNDGHTFFYTVIE